MITPKQIAKRLHAILEKKEDEYGRGFNKHLHHKTGLSTGYLSEIIGGTKPGSPEAQIKICEAIGIEYKDLLAGDIQPTLMEPNISTIEHEHVKVVKQFQQKELALEINHLLLEIERNNPTLLSVIKQQLSGLAAVCYPAPVKKRGSSTGTE